jgi:hypothetical protein
MEGFLDSYGYNVLCSLGGDGPKVLLVHSMGGMMGMILTAEHLEEYEGPYLLI